MNVVWDRKLAMRNKSTVKVAICKIIMYYKKANRKLCKTQNSRKERTKMTKEEFGIKFGRGIKRAREANGLSLNMVAKKLGIAEITLRQYESGMRTPPLYKAVEICNFLDVTIEEATNTYAKRIIK